MLYVSYDSTARDTRNEDVHDESQRIVDIYMEYDRKQCQNKEKLRLTDIYIPT